MKHITVLQDHKNIPPQPSLINKRGSKPFIYSVFKVSAFENKRIKGDFLLLFNGLQLSILLLFIFTVPLFSQGVAISEDQDDLPHESAVLHLISTDKGFLLPRLTETQRDNITNPAKGLLIYNSDEDEFQYNAGDEDSPSWQALGGGGTSLWSLGDGDDIYRQDGNVGIATDDPNEALTIDGVLSLAEINAAPSATENFGKIFSDTDENLWYKNGSAELTQISYEYAVFEDRKSAGTNGGTFDPADGWIKRDLNTVVNSRGNSISLNTSTSVITLDAGTYRIVASAPAYKVNRHQCRFRQTSDSEETVLLGTGEHAPNNSGDVVNLQTRSLIDGIITVDADNTEFELQHRCSNNNSGDGFGCSANLGEQEVYSRVYIQRIK